MWRQLAEVLILRFYGVGLGFYQMAGYWRREVTWAHKVGSLSAKEYSSCVNGLNHPAYHKLSQNKLAEKAILRLFHIPCPEYLGFYNAETGMTAEGVPLKTPDELAHLLRRYKRVCFKPLEGWAGRGFEAVDIDGTGVRRVKTGERMTVAEFCAVLDPRGAVIEDYLEQHEALSKINPSSVNTLRVWVSRGRPLLAYLRIGREGSLVDNQSAGGIVAPVDLKTGTLSAAIDGLPRREVFTHHPDHGAPIENVTVPFFKEALQLACDAESLFPSINFAGLDVAVSPDGPWIIELNVSPDREGAAFVDARSRELLGQGTGQ